MEQVLQAIREKNNKEYNNCYLANYNKKGYFFKYLNIAPQSWKDLYPEGNLLLRRTGMPVTVMVRMSTRSTTVVYYKILIVAEEVLDLFYI